MANATESFISAYVIHTRPFQDHKVLLDLLTAEHGLVRAVWRLPKKDARVIPSSFLPYQVILKGRTDLKTLHLMESTERAANLTGLKLFSAMYSHELLLKLLPMNLPLASFFELYHWLIQSLQSDAPVAPLLRRFEHVLFDEIGNGINLDSTATGKALVQDQLYQFDARFGLRPYLGDAPKQLPLLFLDGKVATDYSQGNWQQGQVLKLAKELHRRWLDYLLNGKEIESRRLLPAYQYDGERHLGVPIFRSNCN